MDCQAQWDNVHQRAQAEELNISINTQLYHHNQRTAERRDIPSTAFNKKKWWRCGGIGHARDVYPRPHGMVYLEDVWPNHLVEGRARHIRAVWSTHSTGFTRSNQCGAGENKPNRSDRQ